MTPDFQDKVVLVTGSSRGIGMTIAQTFAEHGAKVVVHGRDERALQSVESGIKARGGQVLGVMADLTRFPEIERMRETIEAAWGGVDILIANAGASLTPPAQAIEDISEDGWRASMEINLTATFLTVKSFLPGMKARRAGVIITVSSTAARLPDTRSPLPYAAAKAGLQLFTQVLAEQVGPFGLRANCIAPETILTERNLAQIPEDLQRSLAQQHPVQRLGTPDDVAQAAIFLASDQAGWVSGVIMDVAGGAVRR